jgi:hypothetical protein
LRIFDEALNQAEVRRLYQSYYTNDRPITIVETSDVSAALGDKVLIYARLVDQKGRAAVGARVSFHMGNTTLGTVTTDSRGLTQVSLNATTAGTFPLLVETPGTIRFDGAGQATKLVVASVDNVANQIVAYGLWGMCLSCSLVLTVRWRASRLAKDSWRRFKIQVDEMYEDLM